MAIAIGRSNDVTAEMNSTPLIDVMLVLLVMLIITVPMQTQIISLNQPNGKPSALKPPVVDLNVDFDGATFWNGEAVSRAVLDGQLAAAAHQFPQPEIHVSADRLARYDRVATVLADAQRSGLTQIGFVNTNKY